MRVEVTRGARVIRVGVRDGDAWWRWDKDDGESFGTIEHHRLPAMLEISLLRPEGLLARFWLEPTGVAHRAGRAVLTATGTQRGAASTAASLFEFEFDLEHGTPLYIARPEDTGQRSVTEAISVDYAPPLDPNIFRFERQDDGDPDGQVPGLAQDNRLAAAPNRRSHRSPDPMLSNRATVWLTGLPNAGKTTIARATERLLNQLGVACCVLDGDALREGLSSDLGLSRSDRGEQARRAAHIATILLDASVVPIIALVSPYAEDRLRAREIHNVAGNRMLEVWVDTPKEICIARDKKGLYKSMQPNQRLDADVPSDGSGVTGVSAPYEAPQRPDIHIRGHEQNPRAIAEIIVAQIFSRPARAHVIVPSSQPACNGVRTA